MLLNHSYDRRPSSRPTPFILSQTYSGTTSHSVPITPQRPKDRGNLGIQKGRLPRELAAVLRVAQTSSPRSLPEPRQPAVGPGDRVLISARALWRRRFPHAQGSRGRFAGRKMNQRESGHQRKDPAAVERGRGLGLERGCQDPRDCLL